MKKIQLTAMILACAGTLAACSAPQTTENGKTTSNVEKMDKQATMQDGTAIDFSLKGVDGKTYSLSDFKGKKVYLKFWASWCPICLAGLEEIDQFAKEAPEDVVILSVVSPNQKGELSEEEFKKWYKELGYANLPVLLDPDGKLIEELGVRVYPTSSFIDSKGTVVKTQPGHLEKDAIVEVLKDIQ